VGAGGESPLFLPTPAFMASVGEGAVSFVFSFVISLGRNIPSWDQGPLSPLILLSPFPWLWFWAEGKGELATCRHCADSGQETDST